MKNKKFKTTIWLSYDSMFLREPGKSCDKFLRNNAGLGGFTHDIPQTFNLSQQTNANMWVNYLQLPWTGSCKQKEMQQRLNTCDIQESISITQVSSVLGAHAKAISTSSVLLKLIRALMLAFAHIQLTEPLFTLATIFNGLVAGPWSLWTYGAHSINCSPIVCFHLVCWAAHGWWEKSWLRGGCHLSIENFTSFTRLWSTFCFTTILNWLACFSGSTGSWSGRIESCRQQ